MEEILTALLLAEPSITTKVAQRITWNVRKQGAPTPAIVLTKVSGTPSYTNDGESISETRVQIDCWAAKYADAVEASRAVKALLSGYSSEDLQGVFLESERQSFESGSEASERFHRVSLDFLIWHIE